MANSSYQEGNIKRYYENRDTKSLQTLGELASELFLCNDPNKATRFWDRVSKALKHIDAQPAEVQKILDNRDVTELSRLVNKLSSPSRPKSSPSTPTPTPPPRAIPTAPRSAPSEEPLDPLDTQVQKRAMKAFRKRLKLTRLDDESKIGRSPLTNGKPSGVVAITPPNQYPPAVWDELVKQGKLKRAGTGFYALVS